MMETNQQQQKNNRKIINIGCPYVKAFPCNYFSSCHQDFEKEFGNKSHLAIKSNLTCIAFAICGH